MITDVNLSGGWSYFVEPSKYAEYLLARADHADEGDQVNSAHLDET